MENRRLSNTVQAPKSILTVCHVEPFSSIDRSVTAVSVFDYSPITVLLGDHESKGNVN
jgi:hypothetical protein